ncbi:MAG: Mor transcription activator family protein [Hafnia alvei]|uniref:Mor transcription activator family protein n=1 Tax=Hafnia alvei TaxID=569 RepID=UPI000DFC3784|nr:Mor transcription activator family protein [Hafnia alvei]STQ73696.1 Uncharacterized conserved protein [Hafnia alvei]
MNNHVFRSKGPELLVELAHHVAETIVDVTGLDLKVAEQVGNSVATRMMLVWGGQNVYFPMGISWNASQRDLQIFSEFNGRNHSELAKKYSVSLQWIYKIVKTVRKEEQARMQDDI